MAPAIPDFRQELLRWVPQLRVYARSLTSRRDLADDLVQDTITRALGAQHRFALGTNMRAWLFKILRNRFISHLRASRSSVEIDDAVENELFRPSSQVDVVELREVCTALRQINPNLRSALVLVAALGCTYDEAADICGCRIGTIKSRVNRARESMQAALSHRRVAETSEDGARGAPAAVPKSKALFVFGTLKRGFPLHGLALKDATLVGRYRTVSPYPMVIAGDRFAPMMFDEPGEGRQIDGELYEIPRHLLPTLDGLEGMGTPGNRRVPTRVAPIDGGRARRALAYVKDRALASPIHSEYMSVYEDRRFKPSARQLAIAARLRQDTLSAP